MLHDADGDVHPGRTRFLLYSVSKPITAVAVLTLVEAGALSLRTRVADVIPGFGVRGKEDVTVREVLSHSAGFAMELGEEEGGRDLVEARDAVSWERFQGLVCGMPSRPDQRGRGMYHALSFGILGAVVERISRSPFPDYCRRHVLHRLGMEATTWGIPPAQRPLAAGYAGPAAGYWETAGFEDAMVPAAGAWSTAEDVARLLLMLRGGGTAQGTRLLSGDLVADAVRLQASIAPGAWGFGLGLLVDGPTLPVIARGSRSAPGTFGHSGTTANQAFHDPVRDLTVVCLTNACVSQEASDARFDRLCDAIYERFG